MGRQPVAAVDLAARLGWQADKSRKWRLTKSPGAKLRASTGGRVPRRNLGSPQISIGDTSPKNGELPTARATPSAEDQWWA